MECSPKSKFGILGSMYFFGFCISSLVASRLADIYGRRLVTLVNTTIQVITQCALIFSTSFKLSAALLFVLGLCASGRLAVSYAYMLEFLTERNSKLFGPVMSTC